MKEIAIAWGPAIISGIIGPISAAWFINKQSERRAKVTLAKVQEVHELANSTNQHLAAALAETKNGRLDDAKEALEIERNRLDKQIQDKP